MPLHDGAAATVLGLEPAPAEDVVDEEEWDVMDDVGRWARVCADT